MYLKMMLTKTRTRFIKSLKLKKIRIQEELFVIEGSKNVIELLKSNFLLHSLYAKTTFLDNIRVLVKNLNVEIFTATDTQLADAGSFRTNNSVIAMAKIKENKPLSARTDEFALILDDIHDPGNFGTILRICDWYGISKVIASTNCVDLYNPKVIAATMGSFTRVNMYYTNLKEFMEKEEGPFYGTYLDGENIHTIRFKSRGYIVVGNESTGISSEISALTDNRITIPGAGRMESLNAGIATAVVLDNLYRTKGGEN